MHEKGNRSDAYQTLGLEPDGFVNGQSRLKYIKEFNLYFVYIRFFSQYNELEQIIFMAKRLQERYRVRNLRAFILNT